jgi:hypothetical protein
VKRSQHIRLVLIGGLSGAALTSHAPAPLAQTPGGAVAAALQSNAFTNDHRIRGVGYYHAPYRAWFEHPYNFFDPARQKYFHGGEWSDQPHQSFTNISTPLPEAAWNAASAMPAEAAFVPGNRATNSAPTSTSTTTTRSGFGSSVYRTPSWGHIGT